jgi:hypothetical protein
VSGDDGTDSITWVHVARRAWAPAATSHHARGLRPSPSEALVLAMLIRSR